MENLAINRSVRGTKPPGGSRDEARPVGPAADIGAVEADTDAPILPPSILQEPGSVMVFPGATTNFSVTADGYELVFQWWRDGTSVAGATDSTLTIENAPPGSQGGYWVVISNAANVVTSAVATLTFDASALRILSGPVGQTVQQGDPASFSVLVTGIPDFAYQWKHFDTPIAGATSSSYTIPSTRTDDTGSYSVVVSNGYKTVTSPNAFLNIIPTSPTILTQPVSMVVSPGAGASFSAVADGPSLFYQWWHDTTPVSGATNSTLSIASALAGAQGGYFLVITNFAGSVTSVVATLTFDAAALDVLSSPKGQTADLGDPVSFTVLVTGIPPFAYQWQLNGSPIPNATSSRYTIPTVGTNDAGGYSVVVSNDWKVLTSATAQLAIGPAAPFCLTCGFSGSNLTLTLMAEGGRTYRWLNSTDLVTWSTVTSNLAAAHGPLQLTRPMTVSRGFFRVVTP
jgi:hypothetical protein